MRKFPLTLWTKRKYWEKVFGRKSLETPNNILIHCALNLYKIFACFTQKFEINTLIEIPND